MTGKSTVLSPEALDFAPGLLSIQESLPARLPRTVMYTVGVLLVILLLWAIFGKLDIIASAGDRLVPEQPGNFFESVVQAGLLSKYSEADIRFRGIVLFSRASKLNNLDNV